MTAIPATTLSRQLFERGTVRRNSGFNQGLIFAAALILRWQLSNCRSLHSRHRALLRLARST